MSTNYPKEYRILLYYKYVKIDNHIEVADEHLRKCKELELKGRVIIAPNGINGTVSGLIPAIEQYIEYMKGHPLFHDVQFKVDDHDQDAFRRISVRAREDLVTWRLPDNLKKVNPSRKTGKHMSPKEFRHYIENRKQENVVILDGRNAFEYDLGHFQGAMRADVETSRQFPEWIRNNLSNYKDHKIIAYCTGGIRCETITSILLEEGFKDVAQLDGGIVNYAKDSETSGQYFDGKCYVFDNRISVPINQHEHIVIGKCHHCQQPTERYINCSFSPCNHQYLCCDACFSKSLDTGLHYCSDNCETNHFHQTVKKAN